MLTAFNVDDSRQKSAAAAELTRASECSMQLTAADGS